MNNHWRVLRTLVFAFLDLQTYRLLQTCRMLLVFARRGEPMCSHWNCTACVPGFQFWLFSFNLLTVCPYVFIVLVISTAWEISRCSFARSFDNACFSHPTRCKRRLHDAWLIATSIVEPVSLRIGITATRYRQAFKAESSDPCLYKTRGWPKK